MRPLETRFERTPKIEVWLDMEEEKESTDSFDYCDVEIENMQDKENRHDHEEQYIRSQEEEEESSESENSEDENDGDESLGSSATKKCSETATYFIGRNGFMWSKYEFEESSRTPAHKVIHERPTEQLAYQSCIEPWSKLIDAHMIAKVVARTNQNLQKMRAHYKNVNRIELKEADETEIRSLLGLLYYSAVFKCNYTDTVNLFATDGTAHDIFRMVMSQSRFSMLINCLGFENEIDRQEHLKTNPLAEISSFFEKFFTNSQNNYDLGPKTCINEMILSFRGKSFLTNMPKQRRIKKDVIKIMILSDSEKPYAYNAYICCGESDSEGLSDAERKLELPTQSVLRLTKPIENTNRNVTAGNKFSSIQLLEILHSKNLTYLGTLKKKNREIPRDFLRSKEREIGSTLYGFTQDYTIVSHVTEINKAEILISSSHHEPSTDMATGKPTMIIDYNHGMAGFKEIEKQCLIYSCKRRTSRWPTVVFYTLLDVAGVNAYVLYQGCPGSKLRREDFLLSLARDLVLPTLKERVYNERLPKELRLAVRRVLGKDLPPFSPPSPQPRGKRRACSVCPSKLKRRTRFSCYACNKALCLQCSDQICGDCKF